MPCSIVRDLSIMSHCLSCIYLVFFFFHPINWHSRCKPSQESKTRRPTKAARARPKLRNHRPSKQINAPHLQLYSKDHPTQWQPSSLLQPSTAHPHPPTPQPAHQKPPSKPTPPPQSQTQQSSRERTPSQSAQAQSFTPAPASTPSRAPSSSATGAPSAKRRLSAPPQAR